MQTKEMNVSGCENCDSSSSFTIDNIEITNEKKNSNFWAIDS